MFFLNSRQKKRLFSLIRETLSALIHSSPSTHWEFIIIILLLYFTKSNIKHFAVQNVDIILLPQVP